MKGADAPPSFARLLQARGRWHATPLLRLAGKSAGPLLALLLAAGCATLPPLVAPREEGWYGVLPADGEAYLSLAVGLNRALVKHLLSESGLSEGSMQEVIDRTDRVVWCVGSEVSARPGAQPLFAAVASGSYPKGLVDLRLGASGQWARVAAPLSGSAEGRAPVRWWWQNRKDGLQFVLASRSIAFLSNGGMGEIVARLTGTASHAVPQAVRERLDTADLALYFPHPENLLAASAPFGENVPVVGFVVTLNRTAGEASDSDWEAAGYLTMRSPRDARVFAVALKLLIASQGMGESALYGIPLPIARARVATSGPTIVISNMRIDRDRLGELLAGFVSKMHLAGVAS